MRTKTKKLRRIDVQTRPNGYALSIEGHRQEYMYFSAEKLVEGVMLHVGLKMTEQLDQSKMAQFIEAASNWHDVEQCTREIQRLTRELQAMRSKRNGLARQLIDERRDYIRLRDDLSLVRDAAKNPTGTLVEDLADTCMHRNRRKRILTPQEFEIASAEITDMMADYEPPEEDDEDEEGDEI